MNYLYTQHYQIAHNTLVPSRYLAYNDLKSTYPINIIQHNIHTDPSDSAVNSFNSNSFTDESTALVVVTNTSTALTVIPSTDPITSIESSTEVRPIESDSIANPFIQAKDQLRSNYSSKDLNKNPAYKNTKGGYKGYSSSYVFSYLIYDDILSFKSNIQSFLLTLESNKIYTILPLLGASFESEDIKFSMVSKHSIKVTRDTNPEVLAYKIMLGTNLVMAQYGLTKIHNFTILFREWYNISDLNTGVTKDKVNKVLDGIIKPKSKTSELNKVNIAVNKLKASKFGQILFNPAKYPLDFINLTDLSIPDGKLEISFKNSAYEVLYYQNSILAGRFTINLIDNTEIRSYDNFRLYFNTDKELIKLEFVIPAPLIQEKALTFAPDNKIGTFDFETCNDGSGNQMIYAAGFAVKVDDEIITKTMYLNPGETSLELIDRFFQFILQGPYRDYTLYAHNLGKFDGIFVIYNLVSLGYNLKTIMKDDNTIISITLRSGNKVLKLKDSLLILNNSLERLCIDFDVKTTKDIFPYGFNHINNLYYVGAVPDRDQFKNLSIEGYNSYLQRFPDAWDFQKETILYLQRDVISLLEILIKFNNNIFSEYSINITGHNTIAGLSFAIYLSNFYKTSHNLRVLKGDLESFIRSGYYGGITAVHENTISNGYYYDLNSSYPASMLNPMPTGNPIFTTEKDLNKLFGFVEARVTAPSVADLKVAILPIHTESGGIELFRDTRTGVWFTEELREAVKLGYKVEIINAYNFERRESVFNEFVENLYAKKAAADLNPSKRYTSKIIMLSIYGRMGMNELEYKVRVVNSDKANDIFRRHEWTNLAVIGDRALIRYGKLLDPTLLELINKNDESIKNMARDKTPGIISSVAIAAATAAYARIRLNQFTNIPGNPCVYTDTDSVILQKPLPANMVGKGLGQMKLEHEITQGILIAPKTYALKTKSGELITRAKGLSIKMTWDNYETLLRGESLTFNQTKFHRNLNLGTVRIYPTVFTQRGIYIRPIGDVGLIPYVEPNLALVPYKARDLGLIESEKPILGLIGYLKPILSLVVINPNGSTGPGGMPNSGSQVSVSKPSGSEFIAKEPLEIRIPDPNRQKLIRYYVNPKIKSIYEIIKPGMLPWQDGYDFTGWTEATIFTILANCDIPVMENKIMVMNFLEYSQTLALEAKARKSNKQPTIIGDYSKSHLTGGPSNDLTGKVIKVKDNSGKLMGSTDKSWEVAFKDEDEGVKVSFVVFNPQHLTVPGDKANNGPGLAPFIPKTKPKAKPKPKKAKKKVNLPIQKPNGKVRKGKEKKP